MRVSGFIVCNIIVFSGWQQVSSAFECSSSAAVVCREELEVLGNQKNLYKFVSDSATLTEMCRKQEQALTCVHSFVKACLPEVEQEVFRLLVDGSDQIFTNLCLEGTELRIRYLNSAGCIKTISSELDQCSNRYENAQKILDENESEEDLKTLKRKTCCIYFENIHCSSNATTATCGKVAGDLVEDVWRLLGGTFLNKVCEPYFDYDAKSCRPVSEGSRVTIKLMTVFLPVLYTALSHFHT